MILLCSNYLLNLKVKTCPTSPTSLQTFCIVFDCFVKRYESVDEFARLGGILIGEAACSQKSELRWSV